jgi:NADPH-dependent 2,4-dienoyl-CoA reductase/sulfur reductase-like enzyme
LECCKATFAPAIKLRSLDVLQATVIGGGYIGLETAAGLAKNGLEVTIVFPEKHFMERLFTPEIAAFYEEYYAKKGVIIKSGNVATSFQGKDGHVRFERPPMLIWCWPG